MNLLSIDFATICNSIIDLLGFDPKQPLMFSSGLFWGLFIVFIPIFALLRKRKLMMTLFVIAFSLFFFFKSSGWFFLLLVFTAVLDWFIAHRIAQAQSKGVRKALLWLSIVCSLGILAYFKYANFFMVNFTALVGGNFQPLDILLPVGISFYTFRTISYVVDVYKGKMQPVESFTDYLFFLSFFPCLVAGPIVRARDFMPQLQDLKPVTRNMVYAGLWLVLIGVIKKAVVADYIALYNNIVFDNPGGYSGVELLMAILGYTMQIYCDFSGYSDMAIGLGAIMGFDLGINFDFPYRSLNVTEFWRRWHISLSFWLRDYLYIPLGGNRKGKVRQYFNLMTTMLLGGLWHGAAWTFVIWGFGHGLGLCVHKLFMTPLKQVKNGPIAAFVSWLLTFAFVAALWVFFRADSFDTACQMLSGVFTKFDPAYFPVFFDRRLTWCIMMVIIFALHFVPKSVYKRMQQWFIDSFWIFKLLIFMAVVQLVIEFASADVQPFLYAQF